MEKTICLDSKKDATMELPSLLQTIESKAISGFDSIPNSPAGHLTDNISTDANTLGKGNADNFPLVFSPIHVVAHQRTQSISLPTSPTAFHAEQANGMLLADGSGVGDTNEQAHHPASYVDIETKRGRQAKFHSQPMPTGKPSSEQELQVKPRHEKLKDRRYESFKTKSGKLEKHITNLRGKVHQSADTTNPESTESDAVPPVDRFFDALKGPELESLKPSEELVLPEDKKWPFLLRFPISSFGICLGVSSQAILWKKLAASPSTSFLDVNLDINLTLWCISLALMALVSFTYTLKIVFYFEAVRREYYHPIRVNFFFAPWIACLFLAIGVPPSIAGNLHTALWYLLMAPILCLELKIYGQWMSGGSRRLSKVANPSNHLSIVGNFVGALLGASMGLKEGPIFFFAVGLAHYIVLFVTLYQRLPSNETLPRDLHPVFFLFVAAPSVACMAWANISGDFDHGSRIAYFIAMFLYFSLAVRINFFRGFRFSLAWWAYTFPMTGAAIATIRYSNEVKNVFTQTLAVALAALSTITVSALLVSTMVHAFVLRNLFPNDISIAIKDKGPKSRKWQAHLTPTSSEASDIEAGLSADTAAV